MVRGVYNFISVLLNYILTIITTIIVALASFVYIVLFCWLIFLPNYKRIPASYWTFIRPWVFIVNRVSLLMRLRVIGKQNFDRKKPALVICNHQSWVDIPVLVGISGAPGVSKKEVTLIPFIGILTVYGGAVFFDRKNPSSRTQIIKQVIGILKRGYPICLFPEGTRSVDGDLLEPNTALIKMCYKNNISVVPAAIEGTRAILPPKRLYLRYFRKVVLEFNEPVKPSDFASADEFASFCWKRVEETHNKILLEHFSK